jgi:hypothetical protein
MESREVQAFAVVLLGLDVPTGAHQIGLGGIAQFLDFGEQIGFGEHSDKRVRYSQRTLPMCHQNGIPRLGDFIRDAFCNSAWICCRKRGSNLPYPDSRVHQLREQIRPLAQEATSPGCTTERKEDLLDKLQPLYFALFAIQEEFEVG